MSMAFHTGLMRYRRVAAAAARVAARVAVRITVWMVVGWVVVGGGGGGGWCLCWRVFWLVVTHGVSVGGGVVWVGGVMERSGWGDGVVVSVGGCCVGGACGGSVGGEVGGADG